MYIGRIVFSQLIDFLPKREFDKCVRRYSGKYLESQSILGKTLKDIRDNVYLATKVETTVAGARSTPK